MMADQHGCDELRALVREWQRARRPMTLPAPGVDLAETYRAAVQRMTVADEALAGFDLRADALVGFGTGGPYTDEYAAETLMELSRKCLTVEEGHSCLRGALAIKAIAARAHSVGRVEAETSRCEQCGAPLDDITKVYRTADDVELCESCYRAVPVQLRELL